jgi:hypothetical protein
MHIMRILVETKSRSATKFQTGRLRQQYIVIKQEGKFLREGGYIPSTLSGGFGRDERLCRRKLYLTLKQIVDKMSGKEALMFQ